MKTFKRLTALAVTLVFALTSLIGVTAFAEDDSIFSDVPETNSYYEAITSLVADGVINGYDDGTFKPDATITRAEFSKLLAVGSTPAGTVFGQTTTQFSDVADSTSSSAWAIPYIAYAVGIKAINGYEDGTFRPTNPVTYGEAVKMIVCTLGYGSVADTSLTPWYQGYIDIAFKIGLTKNAFAQGDTPAPRALVAQLIYNMQTCPVYVPSPNGDGGSTNNWDSGLTNEETEEGVLLGVFEHCLTGDSLTKNQVLIDDEIYQIGDLDREDLKKLVGYAVSFKYTDSKKPELVRVSKATGENDDVDLEEWQIASLAADAVEYYENQDAYDEDEVSKAKLASDFYVVYNGVVVDPSEIDDDFINDYLNIENGVVTFVSNDGNKKDFEVAFVESYITYFVSTSSTSNGITTFYDKFSSHTGLEALALDEDDVASVTKVTTKGGKLNESQLSGITKNSVTSIAIPYKSTEGTVVKISTATANGTVKEIKNDYSFVKIGTERFEFAPYYKLLLEKGEDVELSINDSGKFYLDYLGRIVFFEKTESTNPYALLVEYKQGTGMNAAYKVNILNSSKGLNDFRLKETVKINGKSMSAEEAIAYLESTAPNYDEDNPTYIIQPIKYKTSSSDGQTVISEIECMDSEDYEDGNIVPYAFKNSKNTEAEYFANGGTLTYEKSGYAFKNGNATQFRMNSSTAVFVVPNDLSKSESFSKKTYSYFWNGNFKVEPYDVNKDIAKVVVVYGSSSTPSIYGQTPVYLVQDITEKNNAEGQPTKNIVYIKAGSETEEEKLVANETAVLDKVDDIQIGDLIKFVTEDGEICDIKKVYSTNEAELYNETGSWKVNGHYITKAYSTSSSDLYEAIYGAVISADIDENTISIVPALTSDEDFDASAYDTINITDSTVFYKYTEKNGFEVSSIGEIDGKGYSDFEDSGEDVAKENAANIVTIIMDDKVVAVYILGE
ncbi:MAG: S-layer homology domain-containing protein [Clostridia bacterium]|nr:S-layer homology domain-containing protein [Clostridia bacterium]